MVEEILNGVLEAKELYDEVKELIIEKNASLHPKAMGKDIRIVPGVVKAFITSDMSKLIKNHVDTGLLSIEDAFSVLPQGYDFEISKKRRTQESENGDEDLFFPRVILNQDSNGTNDDTNPRTPTPQEVPQKKKKVVKAEEEYVEAPYSNNDQLPPSVKDALPAHAQDIFRNAFNSAYGSGKSEEVCFKIAWAAVKKNYKKVGDKWVKKEKAEESENE
jgi:cation transport regulator